MPLFKKQKKSERLGYLPTRNTSILLHKDPDLRNLISFSLDSGRYLLVLLGKNNKHMSFMELKNVRKYIRK